MRQFLVLMLCGYGLVSLNLAFPPGRGARQNNPVTIDDRAPFALELPELDTGLLKAESVTDVMIPAQTKITRLKLWLLQPYNLRFGYQIKAFLNGQALAIVSQRHSGVWGNFLDVDLRQHPNLQLTGDKNVLEVTAYESESKLTYRASFVLLKEAGRWSRPAPVPESPRIRYEQVRAHLELPVPDADLTPPELTLTAPTVPPAVGREPFELRLTGFARDRGGLVTRITLNGDLIAEPPPPPKKEKNKNKSAVLPPAEQQLAFDRTVTVEPNTHALLLEARDAAGNRALAYLPILRSTPFAREQGPGGRRYAVVIGVSQYQFNEAGLADLTYADRDALSLRDFLRTPGGGEFHPEEIVCLTNQSATLPAVKDSLERFLTAAQDNDLIYLFLAGHGAPDPYDPQKLYFLLHDSKLTDLPRTAFPMTSLGDFLKKQSKRVRLVAFFDTCHSEGLNRRPVSTAASRSSLSGNPRAVKNGERGIGLGKKSPANRPPAEPPVVPAPEPGPKSAFNFYNSRLFHDQGWTVITSSGMSETSQESREWGGGHGVFTWALLEGVGGKADYDRDCRITSAELSDYLVKTVRHATRDAQTPQVLPGSSQSLVIAVIPGCQGGGR
ncbi:MAG TPA: caspase family protein [Blastocatellia bacterium]|nr:caspase family protein [Blastocatellia bacterium]